MKKVTREIKDETGKKVGGRRTGHREAGTETATKKSQDKKAVMELDGARCLSCIYTIEHLGRKIPGVRDIYVDSRLGKIFVEYSADTEPLSDIIYIVRRIGYDARVEQKDLA